MNVVVTGAGGFLGSHAVATLLARGHTVRAHRGAPLDSGVPLPADVEAIDAEIEDVEALTDFFRGAEACLHLAGPASVAASFESPRTFATSHVVGTAAVVEAASRAGVSHVAYVSSAEVYGRPAADPVPETSPLVPRSPYGAAKVGAESLVAAAVRSAAIESCVILRPFSVYGPRQRSNSLLGSIIRQCLAADAVLLDDLRPERDYCFVDDVANAFVKACGRHSSKIEIVNVGSGAAVSVGELAHAVVRESGRGIPVRERGATRPPQAEILRLVADVSHVREALNWYAAVSLSDGLRRCLGAVAAP